MSDNHEPKTIVKTETDLNIQEFGSRTDIVALGNRIRAMMPGGENLTPQQAMAAAQYAITVGANPFRGEIYAYSDRGKLQLVEGYKLLIRWAKRQCEYSEWFRPLENLNQGDIGFRCFILRQDKHPFLETLLKGGMELDRAMDIVTVSAGGVVRRNETSGPPPKGWTWEDVAKKRALKNALNKSHGVPSLQEIARESWHVNGLDTQPEDWEDVTSSMSPTEAEAIAEYSAKERERHEREPTVESAAEATADLYGGEIEDGEFEQAIAAPPPYTWTMERAKTFFHWTRHDQGLSDEETLAALGISGGLPNYHGDYQDAEAAVKEYIRTREAEAQIPLPEAVSE